MGKHVDNFKSELVRLFVTLIIMDWRFLQFMLNCYIYSYRVCRLINKIGIAHTRTSVIVLHYDHLTSLLLQSAKHKDEESWKGIFSFLVETMEAAVKSWHETSKVDGRVYFLLDKKTDTEKYAPVVNIDKVLNFLYQLLVQKFSYCLFHVYFDAYSMSMVH